MQKIIEYQELDAKLRGIELELKGSEARKKAKMAQGFLSRVDEAAARLDKRASELNGQYNELSAMFRQKCKEVADFRGVAEGLEEHKEIDYIGKKVEKAAADVRRMEAELNELAKEIQNTLTEFNELKRKVKVAKNDYSENRDKYERLKAERAPEMEKIRKELAEFEKNVDRELLAKYRAKRAEHIFPVFVKATRDNMCGGCRMEIPLAARNELNAKKLIECEECKRFIYRD